MANAIIAGAARGSVLLVAALLVVAFMRRASAARRHTIIFAAIVAQLMIPLFALIPDRVAEAVVPRYVTATVTTAKSALAFMPPSVAIHAANAGAVTSTDVVPPPPPLLAIIWMVGASLFALWLLGGRIRVSRMESSAVPERAINVHDAARRAARALGERRQVRVLLSTAIRVPVTWGVFRPCIVLPDDAPAWESERLRLIILHETAHVRRGDARAQLIASAVLVPFWFNPLLWLAVRQLRATAERAADDLVIGAGVPASTYVDTLLDVVKQLGGSWQPGLPLAMARKGEFEGRMMAVLDDRTDRTPLGRQSALRWGLVTLAAAAVLGIVREPLPVASAAQAGRATPVTGQASSGVNASLLTIAERMPDDIATGEQLARVVASGPLDERAVDRYLAVVSRMRRPIARGSAIRSLVGSVALDSARLARVLDLAAAVGTPIERSITLSAVARGQTLGAAHRARYYAVASSLSGPPLTSALDALR